MDPADRTLQRTTTMPPLRRSVERPPLDVRWFLLLVLLALLVLAVMAAVVARQDVKGAALLLGGLMAALALVVAGALITWSRAAAPVYERLNAEYARLQAIVGSIGDGVVLRGPEGHVLMANPAAVEFLTTMEGFDTAPLEPLTDSGLVEHHITAGTRALGVRVSPVIGEDGTAMGDVLLLRDRSADVLAERTQHSFLDHVGHELRTPLTIIHGYVDLLRLADGQLEPDQQARAVGAISRQTNILTTMVDDLIETADLRNKGRRTITTQPIDLNILFDELDQVVAITDSAVRVTVTPHSNGLLVQADAPRLSRALGAIIDNAYRYSPPGSEIQIVLTEQDNEARVTIIDGGAGISARDLPHIFEPFYRGTPLQPDGTPIDVRGIGQGLFTAHMIVEAHSGHIEVESQPGQGSTFIVCLPLACGIEPTTESG